MKLTEEQLKRITVGAVRTEHCEDGYHFFKYTKNQLRFFEAQDEGFAARAKATTGIRLDFHTSSGYIAFGVSAGGKYEVYVDGLLADQYLPEGEEHIRCELCGMLGEKKDEYHVTLVFPSHEAGVLSYVELEDGATLRAHEYDTKFLFIGDSITQGWDTKYDGLSFAYRVSTFFNAESIIQGTGGAYFHEDSFDRLDFNPDAVIVALGTNDFIHFATEEEMMEHADAHLALIAKEYTKKPLYYISPIYRARQESRMGSFASARAILICAAEKHGFKHIDGLTLVPPHAAFFKEDLLHPNALGFSLFSENLIRALQKQGWKL